MRVIPRWRWENIWLVFILTSCLAGPALMVTITAPGSLSILAAAPRSALAAAVGFGFAWGFGAILFGLSVSRLGVSVANTLVIGLSSALGSLGPLVLEGKFGWGNQQAVLYTGVLAFLVGVWICGKAAKARDAKLAVGASTSATSAGYVLAIGAGVMSAIFNIGYTLALPISATGRGLGYSSFASTNCIWLLMLAAGSIPNIGYCMALARKNGSGKLFFAGSLALPWGLSIAMGVLWGGSIFLYGAATPLLGDLGPSVGWPLSLAVGLLIANLMGMLLKEWRLAPPAAVRSMLLGLGLLLLAIVLCAISTKVKQL
jgi:L-rhamnose-H+ transport protein